MLSQMTQSQGHGFRKQLLNAYIKAAEHMQGKLPICSPLLKTVSLLDPIAHGQTDTAIRLKKLSPDQIEDFDREIMDLM